MMSRWRDNPARGSLGALVALAAVAMLTLTIAPPQAEGAAVGGWVWEDVVDINPEQGAASQPRMALVGETLYFVWDNQVGKFDVSFRTLTDNVWSAVGDVPTDRTDANQRTPDIAAGDGVLHVVWMDDRDGDWDIYYRRLGAKSPEIEISDDGTGAADQSKPRIAADGDVVHVVWVDTSDGDEDIFYRRCDGTKWGPIEEVSGDTLTERQVTPAVVAADGVVHVLWSDRDGGDNDIVMRSRSGSAWGKEQEVSEDVDDEAQTYVEAALDGGDLYVVWVTGPTYDPHLHTRARTDGSWSDIEEMVPTTGDDQTLPSIAVEDGNVFLACEAKPMYDSDIHLHYNDGTGWGDETVMAEQSSSLGQYQPTVIVKDGTIHLAWLHRTGDFIQDVSYTSARVDLSGPSSEPTSVDDYWMPASPGSAHVEWEAEDDYGLASVTLYYRHSTDYVNWTNRTEYETQEVHGRTAQGTFYLDPPEEEGFYIIETRATDLYGHMEFRMQYPKLLAARDSTPPVGVLTLDDGAEWTTDREVEVRVVFTDEMTEMAWTGEDPVPFEFRLSNNETFEAEEWVTYEEGMTWTLGEGDGQKTVYCQVRDHSGLPSNTIMDTIQMDTQSPDGTLLVNGGAMATNSTTVTLEVASEDGTSGVTMMRHSNDGTWDDEDWVPVNDSREWELPPGDGEKTVHMQLRDMTGLVSGTITDTIILDTTAPSVVSTLPADGATDVDPSENLTVEFSEPMAWESLMVSLQVTEEGAATGVTGEWTLDEDALVAVFRPSPDLAGGTTYVLTVGTQSADAAGNHVDSVTTVEFTTASGSGNGGNGGNGGSGGASDSAGMSPAVLGGVGVIVLAVVVVAALLFIRSRGR